MDTAVHTEMEPNKPNRRGRAVSILAVVIVAVSLSLAASGIAIWLTQGSSKQQDVGHKLYDGYTYERKNVNGIMLHAIVTEPQKITLDVIHGNVSTSPYYGINGGFFYNGSLLSIAVINDQPVGGKPNDYGSGYVNMKVPRGTLVWDGIDKTLSVQVVSRADELKVSDRDHYWAQGGISMSLSDEQLWRKQLEKELAPMPDEERLRSAAVYDTKGTLYLIVSQTKTTLANFRSAIKEAFGPLEDGIFLDGDGSSQLHAYEAALPGDGRPVEQIIRLKKPDESR
ncbi:hypothetical protein PCURB6_20470 [Paenibacillus curdlanolyticus]|nr:hypothetical protein PCURB6_20470 [Paenibacillus curdlanolyticus]